MRVLAFDVGDNRVGVAVSDPTEVLATPLLALERTDPVSDVSELLLLIEKHEASEIVVGLPRTLQGDVGLQARKVRRFVARLSERTDVRIATVDERLSTVQAERMLSESPGRRSRDRGFVDSAAAAVILQSYLDARRPLER